jgi:hypothetical protein
MEMAFVIITWIVYSAVQFVFYVFQSVYLCCFDPFHKFDKCLSVNFLKVVFDDGQGLSRKAFEYSYYTV